MRILILTSVYKDKSMGDKDTSTNIVSSFVSDWKNQGHEVVVIHNSHCYPRFIHAIPNEIKKKLATRMKFTIADYGLVKRKYYFDDGVPVFRIPIKKYKPHKAPGKKAIKRQLEEIITVLNEIDFIPDVITGHWASPQLELISGLKSFYNCKTACILHGTGYISDPDFHANVYLKNINHIGCRSVAQANKTKEILGLEKSPFVCYSGVPDKYLDNYELSFEKFENMPKLIVSFVGRLVAYKNVDSIIKALCALTGIDWQLNIVGEGAERAKLEELVIEKKCKEHVMFCGRVSRDQVMEILKKTHVFVMISSNEIFGLVYLEAMAASCLTIASKNGGVDGIIIDGNNGFLCEEGNVEELVKIIKDKIISNDSNVIRNIVENAYRTAHHYSDSNVAKRYLDEIVK